MDLAPEVVEARPSLQTGLLRVGDPVVCSTLPPTATTAGLLLASTTAASLSATTAALAAAGSGAHRRHCGLLSLLLERAGGHRSHHIMSMLLWAVNRPAMAPNACLSSISASKSKMCSSLGSLLRNKQLKKALFSWRLGERRSISARSSDSFWAVRDGRLKSCSTR